jgi:hypothetical protein
MSGEYIPHTLRDCIRYAKTHKLGAAHGSKPNVVGEQIHARFKDILRHCTSDEMTESILEQGIKDDMPYLLPEFNGIETPLPVATVEKVMLQRAFGDFTKMSGRGELFEHLRREYRKLLGKDATAKMVLDAATAQYNETRNAWGARDGDLKPGRAPAGDEPEPAPVKVAAAEPVVEDPAKPSRNPWNPAAPYPTPQARRAAQASFTKAAGSAAAVAMARPYLTKRELNPYQ